MTEFDILMEDPLPEVPGGAEIKPNWHPGSWATVSVTGTGLGIEGSSRLSAIERFLSMGIWGMIIFQPLFENIRHRTLDLPAADILRVVVATKPQPSTLSTGTTLTHDVVHIFVEKDDGSPDIHSFSFSNTISSLVSRPALWLFWAFLTQTLPSDKLELQARELKQELRLETHGWDEEEMQNRIATAFFTALPLISADQRLFDLTSVLYKKAFGAAGRQTALAMLSAEDWRIRAASATCLSKIGDISDLDILLPLLKDQHPDVRVAIVKSLPGFSSDQVHQALQGASQDEDKNVRRAAEKGLKAIAKRK